MKKRNKNILIGAMALGIVFNTQLVMQAKNKDASSKKPVEAEKILPEALNIQTDKAYDQSLTVKDIEITGNHLITKDMILKNMNTKVGSYFNREYIKNDLKNIYDIGYFTEKIKAVPETTEDGVVLKIVLEENTPVTGISFVGNTVVSSQEIADIFSSQYGMPQNIVELNKSIEKLEEFYASKGYVLARVSKVSDDPDGILNVEINEGEIDKISITGNTRTKDFVIKRNILTSSGSIYNENILKQDLARVYGTQAFSDVRRTIVPSTENPEKYNLSIEVDEKRTGSISLGGGIDTGTGLFGTIGYNERNFRGRGQKLSANLMTGSGQITSDKDTTRRANVQFEVNFTEPRLRGTLNTLDVGVFARDFASFHVPLAIEQRIGTELQLSRPVKDIPNLAAGFGLGLESIKIKEGDYTQISSYFAKKGYDISNRSKQLKGGTFVSLGPSLAYDTRNSLYNTRDGWFMSTDLKEYVKVSGDSESFGKLSFKVRRYVPVAKESTLMFSGKLGRKVTGEMPDFASFRMGGATSVRGFREGEVGVGEGMMFASLEYRTPIPFIDKVTKIGFFRDMRIASFLDAGKVYDEYLSNVLFDRPGYGISAGGGLRINVPGVGPIKIDYGIPLTKTGTENTKSGRWNIDFGDRF